MLTTTIDGLWVLQVLTGFEVLAPELGLRPHLPSVESKALALGHPMAAELREQGVIDDHGVVDEPVAEWLTVISKRDVGLVINVAAQDDGPPRRVLVARFAQWWVVLERAHHLVRLSPGGTASAEGAASTIITDQIDRLCGTLPPAPLRPVTLDIGAVVGSVTTRDAMRRHLLGQGLDAGQVQILMLAGDPHKSVQASIVAVQSGVESAPTRARIEDSAVTIIDTPEGRLLAEHVVRGGKKWMILGPGGSGKIAEAVNEMLRRLPARREWHSYRKVV